VPADIGFVALVTSTGFVAPGVDIALVKGLGLDNSVERVVVNFMGCAAAMNGIRVAADWIRGGRMEAKRALVVCVELSSVNAVFRQGDMGDGVISALFGDGCAAMVVGGRRMDGKGQGLEKGETGPGLRPGVVVIRGHFSGLVDGTEGGITLGVNADGITCELSKRLPEYIYNGVGPVVEEALNGVGWAKEDVNLWAIHPGGPKIIEESARALGIDDKAAMISWEVLARYGNMLSASLPFVLAKMVVMARSERPKSRGVAFSFAPGVTVEGLLFEVLGY
jgi:alpha-pyrone synthase